jgi:signal transduction histidine kinase
VVGSVVVLRDVSERRAVDRMKDEFISIVTHELRTPLTSIRGALGLLRGGAAGELPPKATRMVEVATSSSDRLIRLINDILDVERMAADKLSLTPELTTAESLVKATVSEMAALAEASGITLRVGKTPGVVWADFDRVVQALTNLVGNAVKFSPTGSTVDLGAEELDGWVQFDVRDRGPGIPADQFTAVFEHFRQADASDTRQKGGTGLGLAICRGLVEAHGGRIWVSSILGKGATFSFTLPSAGGPRPDAEPA